LANESDEVTSVSPSGPSKEPAGQSALQANIDAAGRSFRDCPECPKMMMIPDGTFVMGAARSSPGFDPENQSSARPQHRVTIPEPFAVSKFEVTRRQFAAFVNATRRGGRRVGCTVRRANGWSSDRSKAWHAPGFPQSHDHPVTCVSWDEAQAYVSWLSSKTGRRYRLLSEAEWEYVARSGTAGPFAFSGPVSDQKANYGGTTATVPVDWYEPNAFGLHQTHGNVSEWVEDCWNESYADKPRHIKRTARAWVTGDCTRRVVRGGGWSSRPEQLRSSFRGAMLHIRRFNVVGFRVAAELRPNDIKR
jgi:formylglycine-generating enzyme required for sulfatase activity